MAGEPARGTGPNPGAVTSLGDLARELDQLRCRAALGTRKARVSLSELAERVDLPRSTVHAYVSGKTLAPAEILDRVVIALGATASEQAAWGEAWFRIAKHQHERRQPETGQPETRAGAPRQLPAAPGVFAGRREELARLSAALDAAMGSTVGISAIVGAGGIGKTWLALRWAHEHLDRFPDGQLFVDLRGFTPDGEPMAPAAAVRGFLDALGVEPGRIPVDPDAQIGLYRSLVAGKRLLILLDNARDTQQVRSLLPGSTCTVLVTSRDRLAGLVTAHGAHPVALAVLDEHDARDLLARRLGQRRLDAEPDAVTALLSGCAGLPLALGIVAGQVTAHPESRLATWTGQLRDAATRLGALDWGDPAASLPAVLSWSYDSLSAEQAEVFGLLGLAPGPDIGLPAAATLTGLPAIQTGVILRELEQRSLLDQHSPGRYRMHDLIRLYATERARADLPEDGRDAALRRLIDFYLHTAFAADRLLDPHTAPIELAAPAPGCQPLALADRPAAAEWLNRERPGLLAAQRLAADRNWHAQVWQLAWTSDTFHWRQGHRHDRIAVWQAGLLAAERLGDPAARTLAHRLLGDAHIHGSQQAEGLDHLRRALTLADQTGDLPQQARIHQALSYAWELQGHDRRALEHATNGLHLVQTLNDPVWEARSHNAVGWLSARLGHYERAGVHLRAALALFGEHDHRQGEANTLDSLGYLAYQTGEYAQALDHYRQALALFGELGDSYDEADTLDRLGQSHAALDQRDHARDSWRQALRLYQAQQRTADADRVQYQLDELT